MKYLVFGGSGYLGGRLSQYLRQKGHTVVVPVRRDSGERGYLHGEFSVRVDFRETEQLADLIRQQGIETVLNLAAPDEIFCSAHPRESLEANTSINWQVMSALRNCGGEIPVIYTSTFHVYGKNAVGEISEATQPAPTHPYGLGKQLGESVVGYHRNSFGAKALCVRLSNAFGAAVSSQVPRLSLVFNDLCRQAVAEKRLVLKTSGTQKRNFITIGDFARAMEFLSLCPQRWPQDGVVNLGGRTDLSIMEVAQLIAARTEKMFGYAPEICVQDPTPQRSVPFQFGVERLAALGFSWESDVEREIDDTLVLYAGK